MKMSIRVKTIILIVAFAIALSSVSVIISARVLNNTVSKQYTTKATQLVSTIAKSIDASKVEYLKNQIKQIYDKADKKVGSWEWGSDDFNEYVSYFSDIETLKEFKELRDYLRELAKANEVDCIYILFIDPIGASAVYIVDSAEDDPCPSGCIDPIYDINLEVISNPERSFPVYVTNTEQYGYLTTAGAAIHDANGNVVAHVLTDITMVNIQSLQTEIVLKLILYLGITIILLCVLGIIVVNFTLVKPIKKLSKASETYANNLTIESDDSKNVFQDLKITTGDEIEGLYGSIKKMAFDIQKNITEIKSVNRELLKTQNLANKMSDLANKDSLTGVKNKTAYDLALEELSKEIENGNSHFGIIVCDLNDLKVINDTYGHECGNDAINMLCNTLCDIFKHSPIYRIGGDEFVAILQTSDYDNAEELINQFKTRIYKIYKNENLDKWVRITAAIGFSSFHSDTDNVENVFKRADIAMYEDKRRVKNKISNGEELTIE